MRMSQYFVLCFSLFLYIRQNLLFMVYLVFCFISWTLVFSCLFWRSLSMFKQAINHLKRLHQIPCDKCAYFTGDYRLKCTVNPLVAMSETAIGCRDFSPDEHRTDCGSCIAMNHCSNAHKRLKHSVFKFKLPKLTYLK
jgi:hypothetical protein